MYLSPAPLYHAAPLRFTMGVHRVGGTAVVMEHFDPEPRRCALIEQHRVTHSQWVPTMFVRMLKLPEEERARYDVSSMEVIVPRRRPVPGRGEAADDRLVGPVIHEYYAGTEGNGFVYCNSEDWLAHPGTVGQTLLGALHITDDDGKELAGGRAGHHLLRVRASTFEYHNDPEKTAASRHPKGWTHAGRRRPPRRGRVPLPHRPQGVHDHHRRGERVPAGGRERPGPAPQGGRRRRLRRAQRRLRRGGQGRRPAGRHGATPATTWPASSSPTAGSTWPT